MSLYDDAGSAYGGVPALAGSLACQPGGNVLRGVVDIGFGYDAGTDTLTDFFGVTWTRVSAG